MDPIILIFVLAAFSFMVFMLAISRKVPVKKEYKRELADIRHEEIKDFNIDWDPPRFYENKYYLVYLYENTYPINHELRRNSIKYLESDPTWESITSKHPGFCKGDKDDGYYIIHEEIRCSKENNSITIKAGLYVEIRYWNKIPSVFEKECELKYIPNDSHAKIGDIISINESSNPKRLSCALESIWGGSAGEIGVEDAKDFFDYFYDDRYWLRGIICKRRYNVKIYVYLKSDIDDFIVSGRWEKERIREMEKTSPNNLDGTEHSSNETKIEESICASIINEIKEERNPKHSFEIVHKAKSYTTLVYRSLDLTRIKWTDQGKWISILMIDDVMRNKYKEDGRFFEQYNKKEAYWKYSFKEYSDLENIKDIIIDAFDSIDKFSSNSVYTGEELKYIKEAVRVLREVTGDSDNYYCRKIDSGIEVSYYAAWPMEIEFKLMKVKENRVYCDYESAVEFNLYNGKERDYKGYLEFEGPSFFETFKPVVEKRFEFFKVDKERRIESASRGLAFYDKVDNIISLYNDDYSTV